MPDFITTLLTPIFLGACAGDVAAARSAAIEIVDAFRARDHADLMTVARVIAFGLASLHSLSLSMTSGIPLEMALRLRTNANALNRSAEQARHSRDLIQTSDPPSQQIPREPETSSPAKGVPDPGDLPDLPTARHTPAQALANQDETTQAQIARPSRTLPTAPADQRQRDRQTWAIAMAKEASEISAGIASLPPSERAAASIRAAALSSTARDLLYDPPLPPPAAIARPETGAPPRHL